jgi:hypothetical protein
MHNPGNASKNVSKKAIVCLCFIYIPFAMTPGKSIIFLFDDNTEKTKILDFLFLTAYDSVIRRVRLKAAMERSRRDAADETAVGCRGLRE